MSKPGDEQSPFSDQLIGRIAETISVTNSLKKRLLEYHLRDIAANAEGYKLYKVIRNPSKLKKAFAQTVKDCDRLLRTLSTEPEGVAEHTEVESGRKNDRPELQKALAACRVHGATLVIAKLDRLARNVAFTANLMDSGVDFVAVDFPTANRLTIHILAAVAEHEREMISCRTKAALAAAKARGVKLGNPEHLTDEARAKGRAAAIKARAEKADAFARDVGPAIQEVRAGGAGLRATARALNDRGVPAPAGGTWSASQVRRVLRRLGDGSRRSGCGGPS